MIEALRTGEWLTPARLRTYPLILLVFFSLALGFLIATANGNLDRFGRPLGTDFSEVWAAGQIAASSQPQNAYDVEAHKAEQIAHFGPSDAFYLWSYPPYFLVVAGVLGALPYLAALGLWQGVTLTGYLAAVFASLWSSKLSWQKILLPVIAFPAAFVNLIHGQNGFLTAALLAGGVLNLQTRPRLAGILFAGLAYKPQYTLMIPFALLAGQYWQTIVSGSLTLGLMTLATFLLYGSGVWDGFFAGLGLARHYVLDEGGAGLEKMQSFFAAARLCGSSLSQAYLFQGIGFIGLAAAIVWLWRSNADTRLKGAGLLTATLLAAPYSFDYDLVILGPALAMIVALGCEHGFPSYQKTMLGGLWLLPLLARPLALASSVPVSCLCLTATLLFILYWAKDPQDQTHEAYGQV
jgi:hypothetical protein